MPQILGIQQLLPNQWVGVALAQQGVYLVVGNAPSAVNTIEYITIATTGIHKILVI